MSVLPLQARRAWQTWHGLRAACALLACVVQFACTTPVIPAHTFRVGIEVDGKHTEAIVKFAEHDPVVKSTHGDSTCSWRTGNCGHNEPTVGVVTPGTSSLYAATLMTYSDREPLPCSYGLFFRPSPNQNVSCGLLSDSLSSRIPRECAGDRGTVKMIITFTDITPGTAPKSLTPPPDYGP
jgi:hypothetical protein